MSEFIVLNASIMRAQLDRLDSISQNISNLNTPGYINETSVINQSEFKQLILGQGTGVAMDKHYTAASGAIQATGVSTNFALNDNVWFVLESDGDVLLTRNGQFHLTDSGMLKHVSGRYLMGESGVLTGLTTDFEILKNGEVSIHDNSMGRISIAVNPQDGKLIALGNGVYKAEKLVVPVKEFSLIQGALNLSNVDNAENMIHMMEITRHVQSLQRAMSTYDELMDNAINKLGK